MKVTKQETVMFSKGRCCFVRFECEGTSDRALIREKDAEELVKRWNCFEDMHAALKALVLDCADYDTWQRPCLAFDNANAALAKADGITQTAHHAKETK